MKVGILPREKANTSEQAQLIMVCCSSFSLHLGTAAEVGELNFRGSYTLSASLIVSLPREKGEERVGLIAAGDLNSVNFFHAFIELRFDLTSCKLEKKL